MLKEFRTFILRGNVVDLAVGVVIGAAFTAIVTGFVNGLMNPVIALFGDTPLDELKFALGTKVDPATAGAVDNVFQYGLVLDAALKFLLIAAFIFFFVVKPVNSLRQRFTLEEDEPKPVETRACPHCLSKIPAAAARCAFCAQPISA